MVEARLNVVCGDWTNDWAIGNHVVEAGNWVWGYGSAAGKWVYCGTGHDHLRVMGLELIINVKIIRCAVVLDALEPRILRIFHCNVGVTMFFDVTCNQEAQTN